MFVVGNFLIAVASILGIILWLLSWMIIIRALISWVSPDPYNPIVQFLYKTTEPMLQPIRRFMPPMAIDFSPLIALLIIMFLKIFLVATVRDVGFKLKYNNKGVTYQQPLQVVDDVKVREDADLLRR